MIYIKCFEWNICKLDMWNCKSAREKKKNQTGIMQILLFFLCVCVSHEYLISRAMPSSAGGQKKNKFVKLIFNLRPQ